MPSTGHQNCLKNPCIDKTLVMFALFHQLYALFREKKAKSHKLLSFQALFQESEAKIHKLLSFQALFQESEAKSHKLLSFQALFQESEAKSHKFSSLTMAQTFYAKLLEFIKRECPSSK